MKEVYLLWFTLVDEQLKGGETEMLIGVYSSVDKAQEAQRRVELLKGFKDHKEGFEIYPQNIDQDNWTAGFTIC